MNLRQMRQVLALAESGNFHRAAKALCMEQPPLSISIRKLEHQLGGPLFVRTTTGVQITAAGEALLPDARKAIYHAEQARLAVDLALRGEGGRLRVAFVGSAALDLLPRLIASYRRRFPLVELELSEETTQSALDGVARRKLDTGLVRYPILEHGPFDLVELDSDDFVLAVPARSKLAQQPRIALSDVGDAAFVMYSATSVPSLRAMALLRCQHSGLSPRVVQEATQVHTILSMVGSGVGLALVPGVSKRYRTHGVKYIALTDTPPGFRIGIALAFLRDSSNHAVARFVEHARGIARVP